jgi:DNA-binding transcriptional LysR family regulator
VGGYGAAMVIEKLADYSTALIASPSLEREGCDFMKAGQRKDVCLLTDDRESIYQKMFDNYLKDADIILEEAMEVGSIEAIKRSVISNLGVAFLPRFVAESELKQGRLQELKTGLDGKKITAVCVYHKNKWITPAMELFTRLSKKLICR